MYSCTATLQSLAPYSQSRMHQTPRDDKEGWDDYERRTWRAKAHVNGANEIIIPPMAFKQSLDTAAQFLAIPIPGRGKALYTKHFKSGVLVVDPLETGINLDDIDGEWIQANSDGRRGSGKRVPRCFPTIPAWRGTVTYHIFDETITREVFARVLQESGRFIGVGRFRPQNGGYYGRFEVADLKWAEE